MKTPNSTASGSSTPAVLAAEILADIETIAGFFNGSRRTAFIESIAVIRESVEQGTWVGRGHQRAAKGIKDIATHKALTQPNDYSDPRHRSLFACYMAASYGSLPRQADLDAATDADLAAIAPKVPVHVTRAWLRLLVALREVYADLDGSRSMPVYTEIGLSPKVSKTLQDAALDLDLTTRRMCPLGWRWVDKDDGLGNIVMGPDGKPLQVKFYFPDWPVGTVFGASRFAYCDCEACGKSIPSKLVVPILVSDRAGRPLGFWFGRDCARNILGIKDAGIADSRAKL
jgi:hypothetical protein